MMFMMLIALYTSRVILSVLGVTDYGIYEAVGGVVGLMTFINGILASGSSRFLTYELGTGNKIRLKKMFSTVLTAHIILGILIVILGETIGLWIVLNKLIIPENRMSQALFCYHLSVFTCFFEVTQVPYSASIISHERMGVYAYMSILYAILKLVIVGIIYISPIDKLVNYASLLAAVTLGMTIFYRFYCKRNFEECHFHFHIEKDILKEVLGYSGWNLLTSTSIALSQQGTVVLINMFFSPGVVTARSVANKVSGVANEFISNFRTAANPQIVKLYAQGDYEGSKDLLLNSTRLTYYLMLLLALPIFFVSEPLLYLWLGQVPPYSVSFLKIIIVTTLFQVFDTSFYTALYAKGQIRENAILSPLTGFISFPILYLLYKMGASPMASAWVMLVDYAILGLIIKPVLIVKIVGYKWKDVFSVFIPCLKVTLAAVPVPIVCYLMREKLFPNHIIQFFALIIISIISVALSSWLIGISKEHRMKIISIVRDKLQHKNDTSK